MEDRVRIIDEIIKNKDYKIALISTFNFEIGYFERAILNRLFDNGVRKISLFVDSNEFEKTLRNLDNHYYNIGLGKKYIVSPVSINGAFHPKIVLLLGERKARLIISSANVTTSGYEKNNEIYNVIDYSPKATEYQYLIVEAIKYFIQINNLSYGLDSSLIKECEDFVYYSKCNKNTERYFIGNCNEPIINQLKAFITDDIKEIRIAVPYFDSKTSAIDKLSEIFPNSQIKLFIQQKMSTFPSDYSDKYDISLFDEFKDNSSSSFYHGKVFLFKGEDKDYILYGSANCTGSALIHTYKNGGNVECDLLDVGECGDFDEYFNNLRIIKGERIISNPMTFDNSRSVFFRFVFAETTKNGVECHINCNKTGKVEFLYKGLILDYEESDNGYIVYIKKEDAEEMRIVFDMVVKLNDTEESIRCWIIDRYALASNRKERSDRYVGESFDIDSSGDRFRDDRINYLKAELMCVDDIYQNRKVNAVLNQQKIMDEEGDDVEDDDFIVDAELHYEYKVLYRQYCYVERIRGLFIQRFLHPASFAEVNEKEKYETHDYDIHDNDQIKAPRKATSEEKRFERFVKTRVKGIQNPEYIEMISVDHYLGIILAVTNIFKNYNSIERVDDIFMTDYVVKTKVDLLKVLLSKDISSSDKRDEYMNHIIVWVLCTILENHRLVQAKYDGEEAYKLNSYGKDLLMFLEKKYKVRDRLKDYLKMAYDPKFNADYEIINDYGVNNAISYLDGLYGYKNQNKLHDFIKSRYGKDSIITVENNKLIIDTVSNDIINNLLPDIDVIKEVANNVRITKSNLKKLVIIIKNDNKEKAGHIESIKHTVSLDIYRKWSRMITYTNGRKESQSARTIS